MCFSSVEPSSGFVPLLVAHSPNFPSLHLRHNSFSNPSVALPISQLILQPFRHFTYVTTNSPTLPSLYLRHNSFSNPSVALPTSQFILQPFFRFSFIRSSSLNSPGETPIVCYDLTPVFERSTLVPSPSCSIA